MQENRTGDNTPYNERVNNGEAGGIVNEYIVEEKDTLQDVADRYGVTIDEIIAANGENIQTPEDLMKPGARIMIPGRVR